MSNLIKRQIEDNIEEAQNALQMSQFMSAKEQNYWIT
jgi:hypothetical protein